MSYVAAGYVEAGYFGPPGSRAMFQLGDKILNFEQAPLRPPLDLTLLQAEFTSSGGRSFALPQIGEEQILLLRWPRLYAYYRAQLLDWFFNVAQGQMHSFSYRAADDQLYTVRLATSQLPEIREVADQRYQVEIALLVIS